MATPDDDQTQTPPAAGGAPIDYSALVQQLMAPPPQVQPDTTPARGGWRGLLGNIGMALAGGSVTDAMSPAQRERAGIRALGDFSTSLMAGSGYYPGKPMFGGLAQGFQGAEQSERGSEEQTVAQLAAQQNYAYQQQQMQLERLKVALPLLRMQAAGGIPNTLLGAGGGPAVPGTATGAGRPGTIAPPAPAYGAGGPNAVPVPAAYMPLFQAASKRTGVPVDLLIAQARQESGFNPGATGQAGEIGVMQIHPQTATNPGYGLTGVRSPDLLRDPATNINFGADYLAARAKAMGADLTTPQGQAVGLTAYNGGGDPNYVANVTRYMPKPGGTQYAGPGVPPGGPGAPPGAPGAPQVVAPPGGPPAPAPAAPDGTQPAPPGRLTFEQFQAAHPIQIDPSSYAVTPPDLAQARAAQAEAARQLSLARSGVSGDPNKSLSDYNTATQAVNKLQQDAQAKSLELRQAAEKNAIDTQRQLYDTEMQRQAQADIEQQKIQAAAAEAERQRQAAVALKTQEGQQAVELAKVTAGQTWHQKLQEQAAQDAQENTIKPMTEQALKAHQMNLSLAQLQPLLKDLPPGGGALGAVLQSNPDLGWLASAAGVTDPKQADAIRLVNGLVANISTQMKPAGLGALREYEWDAFKQQLPSMLSTPDGQQKAVAILMNMNNRIQDEASWMSNHFNRKIPDELATTPGAMRSAHNLDPDEGYLSPQQQMDKELGPIIPQYTPPKGTPLTASGQAQWEQSLPPGKPFFRLTARPDPTNPSRPLRDSTGNVVTDKTYQVRPWQ
jgi:soluble lytic murein transglycosylase-like protein